MLKRDCWTEDSGKPSIGIQYFVHYKGWKDKWDEWVPETRVLKLNEENLERQKILMQAHKPAPVSAISKRSSDKSSSSSKKRDSLATQSTIPLLEVTCGSFPCPMLFPMTSSYSLGKWRKYEVGLYRYFKMFISR